MTSQEQLLDNVARVFARGLIDKSDAYNRMTLSQHQRARLRESIGVDIRKLGDMVVPELRPPRVSLEAQQVAEPLGVDLRRQTWQSQPKFDPGRKLFHYEHMTTVSTVTNALDGVNDIDLVVTVLFEHLHIAWITKVEDAALTRLGFKSFRPDPEAAYNKAGIDLGR